MTVKEALAVVDTLLQQECLNNVQELVFRQSWEGQTYPEIAELSGYDVAYIRNVGSRLWQLLSKALGENVTKSNFQSLLRRRVQSVFPTQLQQTQVPVSLPGIAGINISGQSTQPDLVTIAPNPEAPTRAYPKVRQEPHQDWGEAIDVSIFYGRTEELATLAQWVLQDQCRLVALLGMGGIGKTALAVKLAEQVQGQFKYLIWRSLLHAPPVKEILTELIQFLSKQESALTETLNCGVSRLIDFLRKDRCLLVLDNAEAILRSSDCAGHYRDGYQGYSELLRRVGEVHHQSCLVLISQEKPQEIALLEGEKLPIRSLQLTGLKEAAVQEMLKVKGSFYGSKKEWSILIQHYTGNPLALKMVAAKIQQLFDGNISEFLTHLDQGMLIFDDIRDFLARQFNRLSNMEKEVMYWLAIEREFVSFAELRDDILSSSLQRKLPEALISLGQRSLVEKNTMLFTLQPAVMEYVTSQLIEQVCQEVFTQKVALLKSHALLKVQARDYIQDSQIRLILKPVIERLLNTLACKNSVKKQLTQILSALQDQCPQDLGYAAENLLNLLYQLETCLSEHSFSNLNLRPAYQGLVSLH